MTASVLRVALRGSWRGLAIIGLALAILASWQLLTAPSARGGDSPPVITFPSSIGDVEFMHETHYSDFGIDCVECHHETNAKALQTPHAGYLGTTSIDCLGCHHESLETSHPQACSPCHHEAPENIADETLSTKVVVHEVCWRCHEMGRGQAASRGCSSCHQQQRQAS